MEIKQSIVLHVVHQSLFLLLTFSYFFFLKITINREGEEKKKWDTNRPVVDYLIRSPADKKKNLGKWNAAKYPLFDWLGLIVTAPL